MDNQNQQEQLNNLTNQVQTNQDRLLEHEDQLTRLSKVVNQHSDDIHKLKNPPQPPFSERLDKFLKDNFQGVYDTPPVHILKSVINLMGIFVELFKLPFVAFMPNRQRGRLLSFGKEPQEKDEKAKANASQADIDMKSLAKQKGKTDSKANASQADIDMKNVAKQREIDTNPMDLDALIGKYDKDKKPEKKSQQVHKAKKPIEMKDHKKPTTPTLVL